MTRLTSGELRVKFVSGGSTRERESFLKFPLSSLPAGAGVLSAKLRVFGRTSTNLDTVTVYGHSSTNTSAENGRQKTGHGRKRDRSN